MEHDILEMSSAWRVTGFTTEIQDRVLKISDPELAYRFAVDFEEANLDAMESVVLESDDFRLIYDFSLLKSERGGDVSRLQERILASNEPGLMVLFASDIEGADIDVFHEYLSGNADTKYIHMLEFELNMKGYE